MKSLLVALDDTPCGRAAAVQSLVLAGRSGATVTGASVLDIAALTRPEMVPIGAFRYKLRADVARVGRARERAGRAQDWFLAECRTRGIAGKALPLEGDPAEQLRAAAAAHDAIVIGRDADLQDAGESGLEHTVEHLLHANPRPLIVVPERANQALKRVLVAYDGSVPASRTLQLFTLLGLGRDCTIDIVAAGSDGKAAELAAHQAEAYLGLYGLAATVRPIASSDHPSEIVEAQAKSLQSDLIVMGAYGHRGWRETLLGSFTTRMLNRCPTALFIHH